MVLVEFLLPLGDFLRPPAVITDVRRILGDEFKEYPESALYMIGRIEEADSKVQATR